MVCQGGCDNSSAQCGGKRLNWFHARIYHFLLRRRWIRDMKAKFPDTWRDVVAKEDRANARLRARAKQVQDELKTKTIVEITVPWSINVYTSMRYSDVIPDMKPGDSILQDENSHVGG